MAEKKRFLLRIDPDLHAAVERWAADDLRSINGQMEYLVREALRRAGRLPRGASGPAETGGGLGSAGSGGEAPGRTPDPGGRPGDAGSG